MRACGEAGILIPAAMETRACHAAHSHFNDFNFAVFRSRRDYYGDGVQERMPSSWKPHALRSRRSKHNRQVLELTSARPRHLSTLAKTTRLPPRRGNKKRSPNRDVLIHTHTYLRRHRHMRNLNSKQQVLTGGHLAVCSNLHFRDAFRSRAL